MPATPLSITSLLSGGLITNYYCPSSCRHCLYRSGPLWPKDFISQETTRANFSAMRKLGCQKLHIGGGEPLLAPEGVMAVLETAREMDMTIEYVETNSSWYKDHAQACGLLEAMQNAGLTALLVSISPLHNEFVPYSKVKGVLAACRRTGLEVFPWVSDFIEDISHFDESKKHPLSEYESRFGPDYLANLARRYWIAPGGRALETFAPLLPQKSVENLAEESSGGCMELAAVNHFHLDLYGNYIPGLCAGLAIARDDLGRPLDPEKYPILSILYRQGIGGLLHHAKDFGFKQSASSYGSKCQLCFEIRRFLVREKNTASAELQPQHHYQTT